MIYRSVEQKGRNRCGTNELGSRGMSSKEVKILHVFGLHAFEGMLVLNLCIPILFCDTTFG